MITYAARLTEAVAAVCPITGVRAGGSSAEDAFFPLPTATPAQLVAAQAVIDGFDRSQAAQNTYDNQQARDEAANNLSSREAANKLVRAVALAVLDEINTLRAALVPPLPARTVAQLRTAVQNKITAGTADS